MSLKKAVTSGKVKISYLVNPLETTDEARGTVDVRMALNDGVKDMYEIGGNMKFSDKIRVGKVSANDTVDITGKFNNYSDLTRETRIDIIVDLDAKTVSYHATWEDDGAERAAIAIRPYELDAFRGINFYCVEGSTMAIKDLTMDVYELPAVDCAVAAPTVNDGKITPNVTIVNPNKDTFEYLVTVAFYNAEGALIGCEIQQGEAPKGTTTVDAVSIADGAASAKVFLWNAFGSLMPLANASDAIEL